MIFLLNNKLRKIEKIQSNPNATFKIIEVIDSSSLKSIKYEYQHCISSTNGSISIDISIFWGARFKKAPGTVCNRVFNLIAKVNKQLIAYFGQIQLIAIL